VFLGHYGLAFAAKRVAPRAKLGTLVFAAQWADELWPVLLLLGVEHVRVVPGLMAASSFDFVQYPISHSLLLDIGWGALFGGLYYAVRRDRRGAVVVGLLIVSHWMLDLLVHRPDLPLWPGGPLVGLGIWRSVPLTYLAEAVVFGGGLAVYLRSTVATDRTGTIALWALVAVLVAIYLLPQGSGSPPPTEHAIGASALVLWLFIPWGYWIDRHRVVRVQDPELTLGGGSSR
jgi:hypothetical protein